MAPHEANAQFVIEWPAGSILQLQNNVLKTQSNVLQAKIAALEVADTQKNWLFQIWEQFKKNDGVVAELVSSLLLVMMHQVLAKITNDIVAWINGGGKGKIRVLQDPGKFLTDALDEAGGVQAGWIRRRKRRSGYSKTSREKSADARHGTQRVQERESRGLADDGFLYFRNAARNRRDDGKDHPVRVRTRSAGREFFDDDALSGHEGLGAGASQRRAHARQGLAGLRFLRGQGAV